MRWLCIILAALLLPGCRTPAPGPQPGPPLPAPFTEIRTEGIPDSLERVKRITEWVVTKETSGGQPFTLFKSPRLPELPARIDLSHDLTNWTFIGILRHIDPDTGSRVVLGARGWISWSSTGHPDTPTPPRQPIQFGNVPVALSTNQGTTITLRITTNKSTFLRILTVTNADDWPQGTPFPKPH